MEKVEDTTSEPGLRVVCGHAGATPGQGPFISIRLTIVGERVSSATFESYPCPGGHACGKAICELATGLSLAEAGEIKHATLAGRVGPLPRHRQAAYGLALLALSNALSILPKALE